MPKNLLGIIKHLKDNQNEMYSDGAFQYFIDNQIDVDELNEILKAEEIDCYCETGDFEALSPLALHELNGFYRYVAWGYEWRTGKYLPNIFKVEEKKEMGYAKFVKNYYVYATRTIKNIEKAVIVCAIYF